MKIVDLDHFVEESNRIEGIVRQPTKNEVSATASFLALPTVTIDGLARLVSVLQPGAVLRDRVGLDVWVGNHIPLHGGPRVRQELVNLLVVVEVGADHPFDIHVAYETLHPFTDGNGRSGRALWAWMMLRKEMPFERIGFLHSFYYQALERGEGRR